MQGYPTSDDRASPATPVYDVLAEGEFTPATLVVRYMEIARPTTSLLEEVIAREWDVRLAEASVAGRLRYNGELFRHIGRRVYGGVPNNPGDGSFDWHNAFVQS